VSKLQYRVFDTSLQVDIFTGIDIVENALQESLVSIDKDVFSFSDGCCQDSDSSISDFFKYY